MSNIKQSPLGWWKINLDKKEHSDYIWLDFDHAFSKLTWPNQKVCLNYVNKELMKRLE